VTQHCESDERAQAGRVRVPNAGYWWLVGRLSTGTRLGCACHRNGRQHMPPCGVWNSLEWVLCVCEFNEDTAGARSWRRRCTGMGVDRGAKDGTDRRGRGCGRGYGCGCGHGHAHLQTSLIARVQSQWPCDSHAWPIPWPVGSVSIIS